MSPSIPAGELRRAVSLFAAEWWILAGGVVGALAYGCWVVATGLAFQAVEPAVASATGSLPVSGLLLFAALVWLLILTDIDT